jgi:hypothetical protein
MSKPVPYNNEDGTSGTRDGTWEIRLQPSLGWAQNFKAIFTSLVSVAGSEANVLAAIWQACGSVPPIFSTSCIATFGATTTVAAAMTLLYTELAVDPVDSHYISVAKPLFGHLPRVRAVPGLSDRDAGALNTLLSAEARTVGLASALVTAVNRFGGASLAHTAKWMRAQRRAARAYAGQLASALASELTDVKRAQHDLAATPLGSRTVTAKEIHAFKKKFASHGLPPALAADLARFRLPAADSKAIAVKFERANASLVGAPSSLLAGLDSPVKERDTESAIDALRAIASGHE